MKKFDFGSLGFALLSVAAAASMVAGCGGGGGGDTSSTSTANQSGAQAGAVSGTGSSGTTTTTVGTSSGTSGTTTSSGTTGTTGSSTGTGATAAAESVTTQLGFQALAGRLVSGVDGAGQWRFSSTKTLPYSPGSVSVNSAGNVLLKFDFGCQTSNIVVRTTDCRNSVSARRLLPAPFQLNGANLLSVDLRNTDATAVLSVLVWDSSGQVLRYPVSLRSIENRSGTAMERVYIALNKPSSYWSGANDGVLHGAICAVAVTAQPMVFDFAAGGLNYPAGAVEIGNISVHTAPSFQYTLQKDAQLVASAYPSYKGRLAVATSNLVETARLDKAVQAGIFTVRRDMNWEGSELSDGRYDFRWHLKSMPDLISRGMKVLWILDYGHPKHGGPAPKTAEDRQAYANWAKAAATAFKGQPVYGYELWNEPHHSLYWPNPDPVAFSDLVARAAAGIKSADSTAKVVTGGVVLNLDTSYLFKMASQKTNLSQVDAIGIHPYRSDSFTYTSPSYKRVKNSPEAFAADQAVVSKLLSGAGSTKPVWDTESGYSSYQQIDAALYGDGSDQRARNRQGVLTMRRVLTQLAIDSPLITIYNIVDSGTVATDAEHNFGLLTADMAEKPAYVGLKHLYNSVGQLTFKGYHSDVPPNTHALRWDNTSTGARVFVMWVDDADFNTKVTLPAGVTAVKSWSGATIAPTTTSSGALQVSLTESAGPVFIYVK